MGTDPKKCFGASQDSALPEGLSWDPNYQTTDTTTTKLDNPFFRWEDAIVRRSSVEYARLDKGTIIITVSSEHDLEMVFRYKTTRSATYNFHKLLRLLNGEE